MNCREGFRIIKGRHRFFFRCCKLTRRRRRLLVLMIMLMADESSNFPLQYGADDFGEDMSIDYETLIHILSEDLDPLQVGLLPRL